MADMTTKATETEDMLFFIEPKKSSRWNSVCVYLKLLKYMIYNMLKMVFDISAYVTQKCSNLFEHLSDNLETPDIMEELTKQTFTNRCDTFFNQISKNEELIEMDTINADTVDKLPPRLPYIDSDSFLNQFTENEEQIEINKVNTDNSSTTYDTEFDFFFNENIEHEEQIEINGIIADTVNLSLNTECDPPFDQNVNREQTELNIVDTDSIENSLNAESKCDVNDESVNQVFECQSPENKIDIKISSVETSPTKLDKKKLRSSLDLITQTLKENKEMADQLALETKRNADRISNKAKMNDNPIPESATLNKSDPTTDEMKSFLKQGVEKDDCVEANCNSINDSSYKKSADKRNISENHKHYESKRLIRSEKPNRNSHKESRKSLDGYDNRKSLTKSEKLSHVLIEKHIDLLSLPPEYSLAYCIATNFYTTGVGPHTFKGKCCQVGILMDQYLRWGDTGEILSDEDQYVFYLVVKCRGGAQSPILSSFERALHNLLQKMNDYKLTKLAISKSGLDKITVSEAKQYISKVFARSNIEVTLCLNPLPMYSQVLPKRNFTSKNLWEMESQTDLIMFINLEEIYLDDWKDEVVDNVNAIYPFKDKLMKDITIKPLAAGDVLTYKVGKEVLFCIFFTHDNPSYFECLEKALKEIKSQLTGYRFLGIQQDPINYSHKNHGISRHLALVRSVFSNHDAEIWICGDTNTHRSQQMLQFQKVVSDAIEANKIVSSKSHPKLKMEIRKFNSSGFNRTCSSVEEVSHSKSYDDNDTENWDL